MITGVAIAASLAALAVAALPVDPALTAIGRARIARGVLDASWRGRLRGLPFIRSWQPVDAETLRLAGFPALTTSDLAAAKVAASLGVALIVLVAIGPHPLAALFGYVAFVAPTAWIERRAAQRIGARRRAVLPFVDRVCAAATAGATVEEALISSADDDGGLATLLRDAARRAGLGIPLFDACAELAALERVDELRDLARELARARRGGRALLPVLQERRETLRLAWRAARLEAASRIDGALSLVLVLAYLPALLLLVVVPLFLGLLSALGS